MKNLSISKVKAIKQISTILTIFFAFFSVSLAAHFGRTEHKGLNYELNEYQDGIYYFAMSKNLFRDPIPLKDEIAEFPELNLAADATLEHFLQNQKQWHLENGISHSPPYVYRILQPVIVMSLGHFGISNQFGFLLVSSFGLGLLGIFLYLLLVNSRVSAKFAIFYSACFLFAAVNLIQTPIYTDYLFLGLILSCIYFQKKGYYRTAFLISGIAVLNRETSLVIWVYLVTFLLINKKNNFRFLKSYLVYVPLAPLAFILPRILIPVANRVYPITDLIVGFWKSSLWIPFSVLVFYIFICSLLPYIFLKRNTKKISKEDLVLFLLGMLGFLVSCSLGGNWERFLLTFWPMFLLYDSLEKVESRNALIVLNSFGLLFLGANDFLSFNSNLSMKYIRMVEFLFLIGANWIIYSMVRNRSSYQTV
jgi:hypothetical protein